MDSRGPLGARMPHGTPGSYGFAMHAVAQALEIGQKNKWVTPTEAKREFRARVQTIQASKRRNDLIRELEDQIEELQNLDEDED